METEIKQKHCWSCDGWFPATAQYFHRDSSSKRDGLHSSCKSCARERKRKWQANNLDKNRANLKVFRACHPKPERPPLINRKAENKHYIWSAKEAGCCLLCGEVRTEVLQYHHRDFREKAFALSNPNSRPLSEIKQEIAKCDLMCANCHLSLHYWERQK